MAIAIALLGFNDLGHSVTPTFYQFTCQVVIERFVFGQFVIEQFN